MRAGLAAFDVYKRFCIVGIEMVVAAFCLKTFQNLVNILKLLLIRRARIQGLHRQQSRNKMTLLKVESRFYVLVFVRRIGCICRADTV